MYLHTKTWTIGTEPYHLLHCVRTRFVVVLIHDCAIAATLYMSMNLPTSVRVQVCSVH